MRHIFWERIKYAISNDVIANPLSFINQFRNILS